MVSPLASVAFAVSVNGVRRGNIERGPAYNVHRRRGIPGGRRCGAGVSGPGLAEGDDIFQALYMERIYAAPGEVLIIADTRVTHDGYAAARLISRFQWNDCRRIRPKLR